MGTTPVSSSSPYYQPSSDGRKSMGYINIETTILFIQETLNRGKELKTLPNNMLSSLNARLGSARTALSNNNLNQAADLLNRVIGEIAGVTNERVFDQVATISIGKDNVFNLDPLCTIMKEFIIMGFDLNHYSGEARELHESLNADLSSAYERPVYGENAQRDFLKNVLTRYVRYTEIAMPGRTDLLQGLKAILAKL